MKRIGTATCTTCNPFTFAHSCGNNVNVPVFDKFPQIKYTRCECNTLVLFITGFSREIEVYEK